MKKLIFIICLVTAFFFTGINEIEAQWCIDVTYDDVLCDCDTITTKTVFYQIYDVVEEYYIVDDNEPLTYPPGLFYITGPDDIIWDAEDRYLVYVRISYFDSGLCCTDWDSKLVDGDELTECEVGIVINME
ncbi:MAG: hypothetical protein HQ565_12505 [Bacteroidetes bacterium]|nr:hypothetical protein [Bacteroidota bacterium]